MNRKILTLLFLILLSGCSTQNWERFLLEDQTCRIPCWKGIVQGKTSDADLQIILKDLSSNRNNGAIESTDNTIITDKRYSLNLYPLTSEHNENAILMEIFLQRGIVRYFDFEGQLNFTIQNVVLKFGEPTDIITFLVEQGRVAIIINRDKGYAIIPARFYEKNDEITKDQKIGKMFFSILKILMRFLNLVICQMAYILGMGLEIFLKCIHYIKLSFPASSQYHFNLQNHNLFYVL